MHAVLLYLGNIWSLFVSQIRKMDLEARSLQPSVKAMLLAKLREYKSDLNNLKKELKRVSSPNATQASREELLESGMGDSHLVRQDFTDGHSFMILWYLLIAKLL